MTWYAQITRFKSQITANNHKTTTKQQANHKKKWSGTCLASWLAARVRVIRIRRSRSRRMCNPRLGVCNLRSSRNDQRRCRIHSHGSLDVCDLLAIRVLHTPGRKQVACNKSCSQGWSHAQWEEPRTPNLSQRTEKRQTKNTRESPTTVGAYEHWFVTCMRTRVQEKTYCVTGSGRDVQLWLRKQLSIVIIGMC
jgi:hypothetical protein